MQDKAYGQKNTNRKGKSVSRLTYPLKTIVNILHCFELIFTEYSVIKKAYTLLWICKFYLYYLS